MMEFKDISGSVMDVTERRVKVAISEVDSVDLDNEVIDKNAYKKTISERGPGAANLIYHLTDHIPTTSTTLGKPMTIDMIGNKLVFTTDIVKNNKGNDTLALYKEGIITQHSVGFSTIKDEKPKNEGDPRILTEVKLYEGSAVLWGANPNTPTLSVGKSRTAQEKQQEYDVILAELRLLQKAVKLPITDDTAELLEMRLQILETRLKYIFSELATKAVSTETLQPVIDSRLLSEIQLSLLKF